MDVAAITDETLCRVFAEQHAVDAVEKALAILLADPRGAELPGGAIGEGNPIRGCRVR